MQKVEYQGYLFVFHEPYWGPQYGITHIAILHTGTISSEVALQVLYHRLFCVGYYPFAQELEWYE